MGKKNDPSEPRSRFRFGWSSIAIGFIGLMVVLAAGYQGVEYYTSTSEFCGGSCHTMAEQFAAWKGNTHHASNNAAGMQAECVDCHFLPGEHSSLKAKYEGLRHLAAYLYDPAAPLPIRPVIKDGACLQSGCHDKGAFIDKEIQFTPKVRFKHGVHLGDKALDGHKLACDSCHFKVTEKKHFEVPEDICYLCHLKLETPTLDKAGIANGEARTGKISFVDRPTVDFNSGASRCSICHVIPTASLQSQLEVGKGLVQPITHQTIQEDGVACESCHFEVVKGHGEVVTGNVVSNGCMSCHNRSAELLATAQDKKLMHDGHVATSKADCFDCHTVVEHKNRTDHLDFVRTDCRLCHQDQHKFQRILLAGETDLADLPKTPHLMFGVNVNCMGCHLKKNVVRGHATRSGAPETCAACHTDEHRKMVADWESSVAKEVVVIEEVEQEALNALAAVTEKTSAADLAEAKKLIAKGSDVLDIVRFGNGVHNKKYAIMLLDEAIANFEDGIDLLDTGG